MTLLDEPAQESPADAPALRGGRGRTMIPEAVDGPRPERRRPGTAALEDGFNVVGALLAAAAVATLLFGWLTPMTGVVGWLVVAFLVFLVVYAVLVSLTSDAKAVLDRVVTVLLYSAGVVVILALAFVVAYTVIRGIPALSHGNFFVETMRLAGPLDPLSVGGIAHAIVGTLIQIGIALAITIPLGITTAVFLNEVGGRFARFVRTISDAMTALPSIVAGLFVYAAIVTLITHQRSGFAASLAITVMMLPIVIRSADVVLRLVPHQLREASYALGSSRWRTVWKVVLPTSRSGLATAVILGTARGIGETSPVLLTSGVTAEMSTNPFNGPMISLPLQVFNFVQSPEPNMVARGFGTAAVLVLLVLSLFVVARVIGGRGAGVLSDGQRRRATRRSREDLMRIVRRAALADATPVPTRPASAAPDAARPQENP